MTEKEKAVLENDVWTARSPDARGVDRRAWVAEKLGLSQFEVDKRARLVVVGDAGDPLWEALEEDLSYNAATELLIEARGLMHEKRMPIADAIRLVVDRYQAQPITKYVGNNKVVRGKGAGAGRKVVIDFKENPPPVVDVKAVVEEKNFWASIKKQFNDYAEKRLEGFDGIERADIKRSFENELRTVLESLRVKIHLKASRRKTRISFAEVINACDVLMMAPPTRGHLPNMSLAKKRKHTLAKEYHPDHSGTHSTGESLNNVLEAYELLDNYCKQMTQSAAQGLKTEGNNHGGNDE